jgi:hypothetical protein
VHNDLGTRNLFLKRDGHIILGDFGLATRASKIPATREQQFANDFFYLVFELHEDFRRVPFPKSIYDQINPSLQERMTSKQRKLWRGLRVQPDSQFKAAQKYKNYRQVA